MTYCKAKDSSQVEDPVCLGRNRIPWPMVSTTTILPDAVTILPKAISYLCFVLHTSLLGIIMNLNVLVL